MRPSGTIIGAKRSPKVPNKASRTGEDLIEKEEDRTMKRLSIGCLFYLLVVLIFTAYGGRPTLTEALPTPTSTRAAPTEVASPIGVVQAEVRIANFAFDPHTLTLAVGTTVTWQNENSAPHTVTSQQGWFNSGQLAKDDSFSYQFKKPGTFIYYCENHPSMEGVISVRPGGAVAPAIFGGASVEGYYANNCAGCHGSNREGGTGPALIPERLTAHDEYYFKVTKEGRPGTAMPGWAVAGLTDEEIWALVGLLRSPVGAEEIQWGIDRIAASREVLMEESTLPPEPTHEGNLNNLTLVTEREARSIAVIDGDTHRLLGHIEASYRAHGYAFDPTNDRWVYNVGRDGWVFKIDLYTLQAVAKVRVGLDSRGIAIADTGEYIIVGNYIPNSAVVFRADTLEPVKVIETEGNDPQGQFVQSRVCIVSDVSPDLVGPYFIIALKEAGQLWRIDYSDPNFPIHKVEGAGNILHDGFLSPDNSRFYVASQQDDWMAVVDVVNWELVEKIPTGAKPHPGSGATWEAEDGTLYGATVHAGEGKITIWDLSTDQIAGTIVTAGPGLFIRASDHSPYVWADSLFASPSNRIYVFDKNPPFELVRITEEGIQTLHPEFTADGKFVHVSDWQGNVVRVYHAQTLEKVAEIEGITTPTGTFNTSRRLEFLGH